jgi:hypothetical protein
MRAMLRLRFGLALPALLVAGCSTFLGFEDLQPLEQDAQIPGQDAEVPGQDAAPDQAAGETATPEAGADAALDSPDATQETSCGNTDSDPRNCGACNHDCLAGDCAGGECQPALLIGALDRPRDIALLDDRVFVVEDIESGRITTVPKKGGTKTVIGEGWLVYHPCSITLGPTQLYYAVCASPDGAIYRCPLEGCDAVAPELISNADYVPGLVLRGTNLFWTEQETGIVKALDLTLDGGAAVEVVKGSVGLMPNRLVERDGLLYFTEIKSDYEVYRVAPDGTALTIISETDQMCPYGLASGGDYLVWSTEGLWNDGMVKRWTVGGAPGTVTTLAQLQADPRDVAADDQNVYWVTTGGNPTQAAGQVLSCPLAGCPSGPKILAQDQPRPTRIKVDAQGIYWINEGVGAAPAGGSLMMIAK